MTPLEDRADAARTVLLPLDCPTESLERLFNGEPETTLEGDTGFEQYVTAAYTHAGIDPTPPDGVHNISELAIFAGLSALRAHHADPLVDTKYDAREPANSAEARMLRTPLQKHPGLTRFCRLAREYFVATSTWLFETKLAPGLQAEIAAILLAPAADTATSSPYRAYTGKSPETSPRSYRDKVEVTDEGIRIDSSDVSQWCQLRPIAGKWYPSSPGDLPRLPVRGDTVTIPWPVFRQKLAEYAWHGWARLANTAYNSLTPHEQDRLVEETPTVTNQLYSVFKRNVTVYAPYYASDSENPRRDWTSEPTTSKPLQLEDKRLITAVDVIRDSPYLSFSNAIPIDRLFRHIRAFFPPPRRPSNAVRTQETLVNALKDATSDRVKVYEEPETGRLHCEIPPPESTPLYPSDDDTNFWNGYLRLRSARTRIPVTVHTERRSGKKYRFLKPVVSEECSTVTATGYNLQRESAQRAAAGTQSLVPTLDAVEPFVPVSSIPRLSRDELVFLTRVGLVMERKVATATLTSSMRPLRQHSDGSELTVDEDKLQRLGWLESHDQGRGLLYTVPDDKRDQLNLDNVSNDGFGEITTDEKSLHRKGIDMCARTFASKPDVTRVVRYCDLWRFRTTDLEDSLRANGLLSKRIDVIGLNGMTPTYAAEVETASNDAPKSRRSIDKLSTFENTGDVTTSLVVPNPTHLWQIMRHLDQPDYFNFDEFPDSSSDTYGRSSWQKKLATEGIFGQFITHLHTYRSLRNTNAYSNSNSYQYKIVGHA